MQRFADFRSGTYFFRAQRILAKKENNEKDRMTEKWVEVR